MTTAGLTSSSPQHLARTWRDPLGRAGILARGVLYIILGILAIQFARGDTSSDQVSQEGAIRTLAEQPGGKFLLVLLTLGLAAMCIWRAIQAFVGDPVEGEEGKDRVEYAVKAITYGLLTVTSVKITADNWSSSGSGGQSQTGSGDQQSQETAAKLLDLPAGRWIVGIVGVVLMVIAVWELWKHTVETEFMERVSPPARMATAVETMGRVGYAAKSVILFIVGIFFVVAAVQFDPQESRGLSGSLQELAQESWGRVLLWGTAIGLFLFGIFCLFESKYRRTSTR